MSVLTPDVATFAEFADIGGFKRSYVTALRKAGRLVLTEDQRRVRVPESLQLIRDTADPSKIGVAARHAANRAAAAGKAGQGADSAPAAPHAAAVVEDEPAPTPGDRHAERRAKAMADKEEALAEAAIRANSQALGQLLDAKEVDGAIAAAGTTLRKNLERLPDSLAPQLAPESDEAKVRAILAEAIEESLREVSRQFGAMVKGVAS